MVARLATLALVATLGVLGVHLYNGYGTLEPCAMLRAEVKERVMAGAYENLANVPKMLVNDGDQLWCAKEFVALALP